MKNTETIPEDMLAKWIDYMFCGWEHSILGDPDSPQELGWWDTWLSDVETVWSLVLFNTIAG